MELKIKKEVEETVNIELPVFFKCPNEQTYLGAINESTVIKFTTLNSLCIYTNCILRLYSPEVIEAVKNWNAITEDSFMDIHEDFLRLQSLKPVLITPDPDDLKDIL